MTKTEKLINQFMAAKTDTGISFSDLRHLLKELGFTERIKGDHYILTMQGVSEIINFQPKGALAKPYQVKQIRNIIRKYRWKMKAGNH
jgi:virulence-associated protein VapD